MSEHDPDPAEFNVSDYQPATKAFKTHLRRSGVEITEPRAWAVATFVRRDSLGQLVVTRKRWDPDTGESTTHVRLLTWPERIAWYWLRRVPRFER